MSEKELVHNCGKCHNLHPVNGPCPWHDGPGVGVAAPVVTFATPPGQAAGLWQELCQARRERDEARAALADRTEDYVRARDAHRKALATLRRLRRTLGEWYGSDGSALDLEAAAEAADALLVRHDAADHGSDCHWPECHPPSEED